MDTNGSANFGSGEEDTISIREQAGAQAEQALQLTGLCHHQSSCCGAQGRKAKRQEGLDGAAKGRQGRPG